MSVVIFHNINIYSNYVTMWRVFSRSHTDTEIDDRGYSLQNRAFLSSGSFRWMRIQDDINIMKKWCDRLFKEIVEKAGKKKEIEIVFFQDDCGGLSVRHTCAPGADAVNLMMEYLGFDTGDDGSITMQRPHSMSLRDCVIALGYTEGSYTLGDHCIIVFNVGFFLPFLQVLCPFKEFERWKLRRRFRELAAKICADTKSDKIAFGLLDIQDFLYNAEWKDAEKDDILNRIQKTVNTWSYKPDDEIERIFGIALEFWSLHRGDDLPSGKFKRSAADHSLLCPEEGNDSHERAKKCPRVSGGGK